jgi:hypothetical protein
MLYQLAALDVRIRTNRNTVANATSATLNLAMARRIAMPKNSTTIYPIGVVCLTLLATAAALPLTWAFAAELQQSDSPPQSNSQKSTDQPDVQRRAINKFVTDFPSTADLSTPESALAAYHRASAYMDAKAVLELSWWKPGPNAIQEMEQFWKNDPKDIAVYNQAQLNAEMLEVLTYRDDYAAVISKLNFPAGVGRNPYSSRCFGRINGVWKSLGEDRLTSPEEARENFDRKKEYLWKEYLSVRDGLEKGRPISFQRGSNDKSALIAPDEPLGISVEKADLMGRIEWAMMHGGRDITARKSIEWGEVEKDKNGNRTIRYKYYATIWDKDILIMNQVFTFDAKGNILDMENVEGYPQKKVDKPADVGTQSGMKELVEKFFAENFHDITSRESIEWGDVTKNENGNYSIRYKYCAKIWDRDTKIIQQTFTFDANGKFVSVADVDERPQNE